MRARTLALVPALALALFAGCVSVPGDVADAPELSPVRFETLIAEALPFTAEDGAVLDAWVFRPETSEPVPIIINYSPYWGNLAPPTATGGDPFSKYLIDEYVPRGYAVALASVRGTGLSDGCFTIGGPQEVDDTDKMTTFLATQPWSNGNVAAVAKSYDGTVAQMLMTRENPHVKTIVPVSPISEWYKYNYYGGVAYTEGGTSFNTYYVAEVSFAQTDDPTNESYQKTPTRFCEESADVQVSQYHSVATGDYSAYWQERNYTAMLPERVTASVFYIHGLGDWNVKPDHMMPWIDELRARNATVKMWLGQWGHDYPHRSDWNETLLAWFDSELKGLDNGIKREPLVQVQDTQNVWRDEDAWPPANAVPTTFYLGAEGALGPEPGTGSAMYGDAPGGLAAMAPVALAAAYETEPFAQAMRIAGAPVLTATVSSTGPRATIAATLYVDGEVRDQGFLDLYHRDGLEAGSPMVPGQSYQVSLPLFPQDIVVPAGSVVRLELASSAPEGALVNITALSAGGVVTIAHGEGSALTLPLAPVEGSRVEEPQPEDLGCWTC